MSPLLEGKTAVVTGGASGNGRAIAQAFAAEGANVVIADVRETPREGGTPTHDLIERDTDVAVEYIACDVTDNADIAAAVDRAADYGGIDVMVNNAGVYRAESFIDVTEEEYRALMDVNVKGVFFGAQIAARRMLEDGGGSIINMSSVAGIHGSRQSPTYSASKGAVRLLTYALAAHLAEDGIRVNAIHPGVIETTMTTDDVPLIGGEHTDRYREMIPQRRFGTPDDVADVALFLASDLADYVNGESVVVDGGMTTSG